MSPRNDWDPNWVDNALAVILLIMVIVMGVLVMQAVDANAQPGDNGLDLPVGPVKTGDEVGVRPPPVILPDTDDGDDPRDTPPPTFYGEEIDLEGDSLIYVLDRSGSMRIDRRWDRARDETVRSIESLAPNMEFNVVMYSTRVIDVWGRLVPADPAHKAETFKALAGTNPGGGTLTGEFTVYALGQDRSNLHVVLLSDGAPSTGTAKARDMIRQGNVQGATIDCFGIGATGDFRTFLQGVAADSGGNYTDVP